MLSINQHFPYELLTQSIEEQLAYFDRIIIIHDHLEKVRDELIQTLKDPNCPPVIAVVGPTGVGMSTLRTLTEKHFLEGAFLELCDNPGIIPIVGISAIAPTYNDIKWEEEYYRQALMALNEPLIDLKIDNHKRSNYSVQLGQPSTITSRLRWGLEQCLHYRQTRIFLLDEGHYLSQYVKFNQLNDRASVIYSLATSTKTTHVLFGTYELLLLMRCSFLSTKDCVVLHFPSYQLNAAAERHEFERLLFTFQCHLPLVDMPDLIANTVDLYRRSLGCAGILKQWLLSALKSAVANNQRTLTSTDLDLHALEKPKLLQMARELHVGSTAFHNMSLRGDELDNILRYSESSLNIKTSAQEPRQRQRVGERKPKRDKVGDK